MALSSVFYQGNQKVNPKACSRNLWFRYFSANKKSLSVSHFTLDDGPRSPRSRSRPCFLLSKPTGIIKSRIVINPQSSYFSTSTTSLFTAASGGGDDTTKQNKDYIQEIADLGPTGSLSIETIQHAERYLQACVSERSRLGFEKAMSILIRLVEEQEYFYSNNNFNHYSVKEFLLNQVIDCWRTCWRDMKVDTKPNEILEFVEQLERRGLIADSRTLTLIIDGFCLRGDPLEAPLLAQWLLDRRMELADQDPEKRPDTVLITNVIRAWSKSQRMEAPEMAEGLLQLMHDLYENGWTESGPNPLSYCATMEAWSHSKVPEACEKMEKLLNDMKQCSVEAVSPDRVSYMYVINAWANSHQSSGPERAYALLQEMLQLYEAGNDSVAPDVSMFSKVMFAFARQGNAERTEKLLEQLQDLHSATGEFKFKPNDDCWKAMIIAHARNGNPQQAQGILDELVERAIVEENQQIMPKRSYFIDTLVAWTKDKNSRASEQAEKVLTSLLGLSKDYPNLLPDSKAFEKVILSWSKTKKNPSAAKNAESLLWLMDRKFKETKNTHLRPTGKSMELVLVAWSRSNQSDAPQRAEAILKEMERRYAAGDTDMRPSRGAYTTVMLAWKRSRRDDSHVKVQGIFDTLVRLYEEGNNDHLRPDLHVYSVLMDSWAERGDATQTQAIFDKMVHDFRSNGNKEAKPDMYAYNKIFRSLAFSKDPNRTQRAESLFQNVETFAQQQQLDLFPNHQMYQEMISIWSFSNEVNAAERAEYYLNVLRESESQTTVSPYGAVINAWTRSKDKDTPARSEKVLNMLLSDFESGKVRLPYPKPYKKFLQTLARSKIPRRNAQAKKLLKSLKTKEKVLPSLLPPL